MRKILVKRQLRGGYEIQKKYKNVEKLKRSRYRLERKRYYHLPEPFSKFDWRNPYDNIFIWEEDGNQKRSVPRME